MGGDDGKKGSGWAHITVFSVMGCSRVWNMKEGPNKILLIRKRSVEPQESAYSMSSCTEL